MTTTTSLDTLTAAGIKVQLKDGQLRFRSATGQPVAPALREQITVHRDELIAALTPADDGWPTDDEWPGDAGTTATPEEFARSVREAMAPVSHDVPKHCIGPVACGRLGPCERVRNGECQTGVAWNPDVPTVWDAMSAREIAAELGIPVAQLPESLRREEEGRDSPA